VPLTSLGKLLDYAPLNQDEAKADTSDLNAFLFICFAARFGDIGVTQARAQVPRTKGRVHLAARIRTRDHFTVSPKHTGKGRAVRDVIPVDIKQVRAFGLNELPRESTPRAYDIPLECVAAREPRPRGCFKVHF
jgi:hypothetical protein